MLSEHCCLLAEPPLSRDHFLCAVCVFTTHSVCLLSQLLQEDGDPPVNESLSIENTLWASTVVASGKYVTVGAVDETANSQEVTSTELCS